MMCNKKCTQYTMVLRYCIYFCYYLFLLVNAVVRVCCISYYYQFGVEYGIWRIHKGCSRVVDLLLDELLDQKYNQKTMVLRDT